MSEKRGIICFDWMGVSYIVPENEHEEFQRMNNDVSSTGLDEDYSFKMKNFDKKYEKYMIGRKDIGTVVIMKE